MSKEIIVIKSSEELIKILSSEVKNSVEAAVTKLQLSQRNKKVEDIYLTRKELAEKLRCSYSSIHRRVNDGTLFCHKFGRKSLFKVSEVNQALIAINMKGGKL